MKPFKIIISLILSVMTAVACCACTESESSQIQPTTVEVPTTEQVQESTTLASTDDTVIKPEEYNFLAIKQKADEITVKFDKVISDEKYNGVTYFKIGNDFEYISTTGYANAEKHISNSINTNYYVGSITKQFTAVAIMKLAEEGKLSVDDTLDKYYPSYENGKNITIKHLLTMTSGIVNYVVREDETDIFIQVDEELSKAVKKDNSKKENKKVILNWIRDKELLFEPGEKFMYSDSNYYLLGDIIEKVSSTSYEKYLKENIFVPVKMNLSGFSKTDNLAVSYNGVESDEEMFYKGVAFSSTGMVSSISDLIKWVDSLNDEKILSKKSINEMFTPYKDNYGYGVYVYGNRVYESGKNENFYSMLSYTTDESEVYVSLSNDGNCKSTDIYGLFKKSIRKFYK